MSERRSRAHPEHPMRVQIVYTIEVSDEYRRAINAFYGRPGFATRGEVREWYMAYGTSMDHDLVMPAALEGIHHG